MTAILGRGARVVIGGAIVAAAIVACRTAPSPVPTPPAPAPAPVAAPLPPLPAAEVFGRLDRPTRVKVDARETTVVDGPIATSTISITLRNPGDAVDEGLVGLRLPPGAVIGRLVLDVDGRWMEGEVMPTAAAVRFYEGIVRPAIGPRRDPALLTARGAGEWALDVFPVPPAGERRVDLQYQRLVGDAPGAARVEPLPPSMDGGGWAFAITSGFAADRAPPAGAPPVRLVIALDTSLSMGKAGLARAVEVARALRAAHPGARLVTGDLHPRACTTDVEQCLAAVAAVGAGGATDLEALLAEALRVAAAGDGPAAIALVSDGRPSAGGNPETIRWLVDQRTRAAPIAVHTLGVARAWTPLLAGLAAAGLGTSGTDADVLAALARPRPPRFAIEGADALDVDVAMTARGPVVLGRLRALPPRLELVRTDAAGTTRAAVALPAPARGFGVARLLGARLLARALDDAAPGARAWGIATDAAAMLALETDEDYTARGIARYKAVERALERGEPAPPINDETAARDRALGADGDGDTVLDGADACPGEPETWNGIDDEDGCPDRALVRIMEQDIRIIEHVYFEKGRDRLLPRAMPLVEEIAAVLRAHPELRLVAVEGHTDRREPDRARLGRRRAENVRRTLVYLGVEPARLTTVDWGDTRPLAPGRTELERARNRRVELRVLLALAPDDPLTALTADELRALYDELAAAGFDGASHGGDDVYRALMRLPAPADLAVLARRHALAERWLATLVDPDVRLWTSPARLALSADLLAWLGRADDAARRRSEIDEQARGR